MNPDRSKHIEVLTFQVCIEEVPRDTLDRVVNWQHVNPLPILHIRTLVNRDDIPETNAEVASDHLVHADLRLFTGVIGEHNAYRILPFLALCSDKHVKSNRT